MALLPDPIFFNQITRDKGVRKAAFFIENTSAYTIAARLEDLQCPDWIYLEAIDQDGNATPMHQGRVLTFAGHTRVRFVASVSTGHPFLPASRSTDQVIALKTTEVPIEPGDDIDAIDWSSMRNREHEFSITITIQDIVDESSDYRGVFAIDFGTTNTCYAFKNIRVRGEDPRSAHEKPAVASGEIPSVIYFEDVHNRENPKYQIGEKARRLISQNSHQIYSYFMGTKRDLGQGKRAFALDSRAGRRQENRQEWSAEEIASFIIRRVIEQAESELSQKQIGTRINEIVATFPTVFSPRRKQAIRKAFALALESLQARHGGSTEGRIRLQIDEANAASFNYVAGPMLAQFKELARNQDQGHLLTLDFGGGTIDVSLLKACFERSEDDRTTVKTELLGITGEAFFGGDNMTLGAFKLLKKKLAVAIAEERLASIEAGAAADQAVKDDPWGEDAGDDDWGDEPVAEAKEIEPEEVIPAHLTDIVNDEDQGEAEENRYLETLKALRDAPDQASEELIEEVVATRWSSYADEAPHKELMAKKLFHELWLEADKLKLMLSKGAAEAGQASIQAPLERLARFAGIDPKVFNDEVTLSLEELNAIVEAPIVAALEKAKALVDSGLEAAQQQQAEQLVAVGATRAATESAADDDFGVLDRLNGARQATAARTYSALAEKPSFKVLLAGNASALPLVREKVLEIFEIDARDIVRPNELKTSVAQGAAEELFLRRQFGAGGHISFESRSFLDALPYSVGLFNSHLGFVDIFSRGTETGATTRLDAEACHLIHEQLEDLALYADYHDGTGPQYLGWFDFSKPNENKWGRPELLKDETFAIEFRLREDRAIEAVNLKTGGVTDIEHAPEEAIDAASDPFSGLH
jgi:molecular chaperone DnaK (HSP70)